VRVVSVSLSPPPPGGEIRCSENGQLGQSRNKVRCGRAFLRADKDAGRAPVCSTEDGGPVCYCTVISITLYSSFDLSLFLSALSCHGCIDALSILLALPALLAIIAFSYRAYTLVSQGTRHGLGTTWALYIPSQLLALGAVATLVARAVILSQQDSGYAVSSMLGMGVMIVTWLLSMALNHLENIYEIRASPYIFSYSAISVIASAITIRTMHDTLQTSQGQFKCFVAYIAINCAHLVVESWPRGRTVIQKKSNASEYEKANMFSRIR